MAGAVGLAPRPASPGCSRFPARASRHRWGSYALVADGELRERSCLSVPSDPGMPIHASSSGTTGTAATALDSFSAVATLTGSPRAAALAVASAMPAPRATAVNVSPRICTARVNSGPNRNRVLTETRASLAEVHDDGWTERRRSSVALSRATLPMVASVASLSPSLE